MGLVIAWIVAAWIFGAVGSAFQQQYFELRRDFKHAPGVGDLITGLIGLVANIAHWVSLLMALYHFLGWLARVLP